MWQRPQHLISRLARGRTTWFIEEPWPTSDVTEPVLRTVKHGDVRRVWLEVPGEPRPMTFGEESGFDYLAAINELIGQARSRVCWLYTPMALPYARALEPQVLVYDVMDDLASFSGAVAPMVLRQRQALKAADVVFTGGRSLHRGVSDHCRGPVFLHPSGVEPEHYAAARAHRRRHERPVAGYVGVIDERLDLALVAQLAELLPHWRIELAGPTVKIDEHSLPRRENIHYLGMQPYDRLPEVMGGFDVALMPFALNDATRSISPTKTLEYLAAGLPVVSTRIPDVVSDFGDVVDLQEDAPGFARACGHVIDHDIETRDARFEDLLRRHHWDTIAAQMEAAILAQFDSVDPRHGEQSA